MKSLAKLVFCTVGACVLTSLSGTAAEPSAQVEARVEIYEFPPAKAVAWQKTFEESPEPERQKLVADLRAMKTDGARTVGVGQRVATLNQPSTVETVEMYRYPTEFTTKEGFAVPAAFEVNKVGCTMTLQITSAEPGNTFTVDANIRDVALLNTQHYAASRTDQPGSIEQPVFASQTVATRFQLTPGVPKLVSVYAPHKDDKTSDTLRLIFVTVRPDK